jgi:hypothetical protein
MSLLLVVGLAEQEIPPNEDEVLVGPDRSGGTGKWGFQPSKRKLKSTYLLNRDNPKPVEKRRKVTQAATEEALEVIKADAVGAWAMVVNTGVQAPKTVMVPNNADSRKAANAALVRAIADWLIEEAKREEADIEMLLLAA